MDVQPGREVVPIYNFWIFWNIQPQGTFERKMIIFM